MSSGQVRNYVFVGLLVIFVPLALYSLAKGNYLLFALIAAGTWLVSKTLDKHLARK